MVAYSFKAQFEEPIVTGSKVQTLRNNRKRHARPGELLQLYTGMRTRYCRLIGFARCIAASPIRLDLDAGEVAQLDTGLVYDGPANLDAFARMDGFASWQALRLFWQAEHPGVPQWEGVRIVWGASFQRTETVLVDP